MPSVWCGLLGMRRSRFSGVGGTNTFIMYGSCVTEQVCLL